MCRNFLKALLDDLHRDYSIEAIKNADAPFDSKRSAAILEKTTGHNIGIIGEYTLKTIKGLKLSKLTAGFELDLEMLEESEGDEQPLEESASSHNRGTMR